MAYKDYIPFALLVCILTMCVADEQTSITTSLGVINGELTTSEFRDRSLTIKQFLGIRYGTAERFQKAVLAPSFSEPQDATKYGASCPQIDLLQIGLYSTEEDCLFLNIAAPTEDPDQPTGHAVMVYIHGGGFSIGSGNMLIPNVLVGMGNVIVVTINYRLGFFGFLNSGDDRAPGNLGFWDQQLALQWVNKHIGAFGGDVNRVTLFGQSAGAVSAFIQGMFLGNQGLFQNIIAESGAPTCPMTTENNNVGALNIVAEKIGCSVENLDATLKCVKDVKTSVIVELVDEAIKSGDFAYYMSIQFIPTIDDQFIKRLSGETVRDAIEGNPSKEVEFLRSMRLINGMNKNEGGMWVQYQGPDVENFLISHADLKAYHIATMLPLVLGTGQPAPDTILDMVAAEYTDWNNITNARNMFVKFFGDAYFNVPGYEYSLIHSNSSTSSSWQYSFEANVGFSLLPTPSWLTNNHGDEGAPVFGHCAQMYKMLNITEYELPEWELELSERMMGYWSTFAKQGDPNGVTSADDTVSWPQFDVESQTHIKFDQTDGTGQHLFGREHQFWRETVPRVLELTEHCGDALLSKKAADTCDAEGNCG